ncbi:MAG: 3-isopropylmalate dehydratase large subunit [Candidatus Omnitrophica bacterium CG1_02_49_10]|nr:MAG: 3-isopropylmalate dehydratase large subunit [Candidatus Omnitrophica bacterium CG1_02_49_10]
MGYTITEKILLAHTDEKSITPGQLIMAKVDMALGNDITAPLAINEFEKLDMGVFDKDKIALIPDHFTPNKDLKSAEQSRALRDFAIKHDITHYYEVGRAGIEHVLLPEMGIVGPGDLVVGADSHTCTYGALGAFSTGVGSTDLAFAMAMGKCWFKVPETIKFIYKGILRKWVGGKDLILHTIGDIGVDGALYKSMEFSGDAIRRLPMDDRFSMCNMAIEAGGKSGIAEPDALTRKYTDQVQNSKFKNQNYKLKFKDLKSDKGARYADVKEYDVSKLEPQVALPHLPSHVKPVGEVRDVKIDQSVIGSCTNGRISDFRMAAKILKGKKAHKGVRLIILPGTQAVYKEAIREGLMEIFLDAGAVISTPTCGPCLGGHMGILAAGERAIATTNRNFIGRMGSLKSEVYLSNPAVAAASAVKGMIAHPEEVC